MHPFCTTANLSEMGALCCFPGAGVGWDRDPSHHIFNSRKQRFNWNVLQSQSAACRSQSSSLLRSLHSTRAPPSHDNSGVIDVKTLSPKCPTSFSQTIAGLFRDLLVQQASCWAVWPIISKQQLSSPSNGFRWWNEWNKAVSSSSWAGQSVVEWSWHFCKGNQVNLAFISHSCFPDRYRIYEAHLLSLGPPYPAEGAAQS